MNKRLNVLFIGLGSAGKRHLRILKGLARIEALWLPSGIKDADRSFMKAYEIKEQSSFKAAVAEKVDFAVVANPTSLHVRSAMKLAKAAIPFFLEKPVSDSAERLAELSNIVSMKKLPVLIGYTLRHNPAFWTVRDCINRGCIGRPLSLYAEIGQWLPDWHPHEDYRKSCSAKRNLGGGVVLDLSHEIDMAVALFGKVKKVSAVCGHLASMKIETEDIAEISLVHKNGRMSHIHLDYCQRVYSRSLRVFGEAGTIIWDYSGGQVVLNMPGKNRRTVWKAPAGFSRDDMFKNQMRHWLAVLKGNVRPEVSLRDGIYVTKIALAAKRASDEERHIYVD